MMTGTLDLSGQISGQGQFDELITVLQGPLQATFSNGLIKQGKTLARVLEVLNVTEIVKGRLPQSEQRGVCLYDDKPAGGIPGRQAARQKARHGR